MTMQAKAASPQRAATMPTAARFRHLPELRREAMDRRICAIAAYWAAVYRSKYGDKALQCATEKVLLARDHAPGLRFNIWSMVFLALSKDYGRSSARPPRHVVSAGVHRVLRLRP